MSNIDLKSSLLVPTVVFEAISFLHRSAFPLHLPFRRINIAPAWTLSNLQSPLEFGSERRPALGGVSPGQVSYPCYPSICV